MKKSQFPTQTQCMHHYICTLTEKDIVNHHTTTDRTVILSPNKNRGKKIQ